MMGELEPNGIDQHEPGAKMDAGKPRVDLVLDGFSRALLAVADVAEYGARKYTDYGWYQVANGQKRYRASGDRHRLHRSTHPICQDSGRLHLAHECWNRLAELELLLLESEND